MLRETKNVRLALETVINSLPAAQLVGRMFVYTGDCAPAIQGMLRMKGSIEVFPEVKRLLLLPSWPWILFGNLGHMSS